MGILNKAEELFDGKMTFSDEAKDKIVNISEGYPYFVQMLGRECVAEANRNNENQVTKAILTNVLEKIEYGRCFPNLESAYQRAIGNSEDRQFLLHLLADQEEEQTLSNEDVGRVFLKKVRRAAEAFDIKNLDQNLPRLLEAKYGPVLENPVFRLYVRLRDF